MCLADQINYDLKTGMKFCSKLFLVLGLGYTSEVLFVSVEADRTEEVRPDLQRAGCWA